MRDSAPPLNRFLVNSQYSVLYRSSRKFRWLNESKVDYGLLYILSGNVSITSGEVLTPGHVLLFEPASRFIAEGQNVETLSLTVSPSHFIDLAVRMRLVGSTETIAFSSELVKNDKRITAFAGSLVAELTAEDAGKDIVLGALVEQVLVHLLRNFSNMRRSEELELSRVGLIDRRIRRAVELMHAQLDRDLSLKEIAAASFLSPFHFARLFKKLTGSSPHAYLATLRTKRAQLLLAETDHSITEISSRVGYASASHFTKAFRQSTGMTPRAFRKALVSR